MRSPLAAGLSAAVSYRRLAGVLWLSLLFSAAVASPAIRVSAFALDQSPFRESVLSGWDSWAFLTWLALRPREVAVFGASVAAAAGTFLVVDLFLSMGAIRVLLAGVRRPVLRRIMADGAALFRPAAWGFLRYAATLAFWVGALAIAPAFLLGKVAGEEAPPNNALATAGVVWAAVASLVVFLNVNARFALARIALARDDAPTARGAYRVAKRSLRGNRPSAVLLALGWLLAGLAVQSAFTRLGLWLNPRTDAGTTGLFLLRQAGFFLLAMTRVGYWGSFLRWEETHRLAPFLPVPPIRVAAGPAASPSSPEPSPGDVPEPRTDADGPGSAPPGESPEQEPPKGQETA